MHKQGPEQELGPKPPTARPQLPPLDLGKTSQETAEEGGDVQPTAQRKATSSPKEPTTPGKAPGTIAKNQKVSSAFDSFTHQGQEK